MALLPQLGSLNDWCHLLNHWLNNQDEHLCRKDQFAARKPGFLTRTLHFHSPPRSWHIFIKLVLSIAWFYFKKFYLGLFLADNQYHPPNNFKDLYTQINLGSLYISWPSFMYHVFFLNWYMVRSTICNSMCTLLKQRKDFCTTAAYLPMLYSNDSCLAAILWQTTHTVKKKYSTFQGKSQNFHFNVLLMDGFVSLSPVFQESNFSVFFWSDICWTPESFHYLYFSGSFMIPIMLYMKKKDVPRVGWMSINTQNLTLPYFETNYKEVVECDTHTENCFLNLGTVVHAERPPIRDSTTKSTFTFGFRLAHSWFRKLVNSTFEPYLCWEQLDSHLWHTRICPWVCLLIPAFKLGFRCLGLIYNFG